MSALTDLVEQVLAEAGRVKEAHVEKVAAAVVAAPPTEMGTHMRKLAAELRASSASPSYAELDAFLRGVK